MRMCGAPSTSSPPFITTVFFAFFFNNAYTQYHTSRSYSIHPPFFMVPSVNVGGVVTCFVFFFPLLFPFFCPTNVPWPHHTHTHHPFPFPIPHKQRSWTTSEAKVTRKQVGPHCFTLKTLSGARKSLVLDDSLGKNTVNQF